MSNKAMTTSLRDEVMTLVNTVDRTYYQLGNKLREVALNGYFKAWGFDKFEDYVEQELGFARRKAMYLMHIAEKAEQIGAPEAELEAIGWTKAKEILRLVSDLDEFQAWSKRAHTMSVSHLQESLKAAFLGTKAPKKGKDAEGNKTVETESGMFHILEIALAEDQYQNVKLALEAAGHIAKSDKAGHLLDMICLDFLSHNSEVTNLGEKIAEWVNRGLIEVDE